MAARSQTRPHLAGLAPFYSAAALPSPRRHGYKSRSRWLNDPRRRADTRSPAAQGLASRATTYDTVLAGQANGPTQPVADTPTPFTAMPVRRADLD